MPITQKLAAAILATLALAGCQRPKETEDERIRREAAHDTRQIKQDAKSFATDTKKEALHARQQVRDIVAGVKEGLADPSKPAGSAPSFRAGQIDINSASAAQLETLPGVSPLVARRILANRPYSSTEDLVAKAHLRQSEYDRISDRVVAR